MWPADPAARRSMMRNAAGLAEKLTIRPGVEACGTVELNWISRKLRADMPPRHATPKRSPKPSSKPPRRDLAEARGISRMLVLRANGSVCLPRDFAWA